MSSNSTRQSQLQLQAIRQRNEPKQPKQRRLVLPEEEYTSTLSTIIQRDFYPSLTNLQEQSKLLSQQNYYHPNTLARKLHQLQAKHEREEQEKAKQEEEGEIELHQDGDNSTPGNRVVNSTTTSTELVVADQESGQLIRATARPLHEETLTGFHARVTSEDDYEFDQQQKKEVSANRQRLISLFHLSRMPSDDAPKQLTAGDDLRITPGTTAEDMISAARKAEQKRIQAAKDESEMASDDFESESNQPTNRPVPPIRNGLFSPPTPQVHGTQQGTNQISQKLLTNGESNDESSKGDNLQLAMPPPLPVRKQDKAQQSTSQSSLPKSSLVEFIPKYCLEKKIVPSQTRFPPPRAIPPNADLQRRLFGQTSSAVSRYNPRRRAHQSDSESDGWSTDASTDLDAPLRPIEVERRKQQAKRVKAQDTYVNMTPVIEPGSGRHRSPITTWGTVAFTPIVVSGGEHIEQPEDSHADPKDDTNAYKMAEENARDAAARKAEEELERRAKRAKSIKSSDKRSRSNKAYKRGNSSSTLSNAASRLMASRLGSSSRQRDSFASALRGSYTPQRQSSLLSSSSKRRKEGSLGRGGISKRSRKQDHAHNATPLASRSVK